MKKLEISIKKDVFNKVYLPYLYDETKTLIFYGGAGSGKSYFVVSRYILKILKSEMCNILVVRQVGDTNRDSTYALFRQVISNWNLNKFFKCNGSNLTILCKLNGNEIKFKGLDNVEKLKSITGAKGELTDIWIEEASEIEEKSYNQLVTRLRGGNTKKQIVLSFNPISVNHWLKRRFFDIKKTSVKILHTTYKDNKFIDDDYKKELEAFKETDPYFYEVYCLGRWGVLGKSIFPKEKVQKQIEKGIKPIKTGTFNTSDDDINNYKFGNDTDGAIKIYKMPEKNKSYVLGGDTAGEGSDRFTGHVLDAETGEQVAVLMQEFDEGEYARQIYCLGTYYNNALIGIETNFSTFPIKELQRFNYDNLFLRRREDSITGRLIKSYGFKTTSVTRPLIISKLVEKMKNHSEGVVDLNTLYEMQSFVRNEKGRPEAEAGAHDDNIMGLAIAEYLRDFATITTETEEKPKVKWTNDMFEDYYNAKNDEERALIIETYGNPF